MTNNHQIYRPVGPHAAHEFPRAHVQLTEHNFSCTEGPTHPSAVPVSCVSFSCIERWMEGKRKQGPPVTKSKSRDTNSWRWKTSTKKELRWKGKPRQLKSVCLSICSVFVLALTTTAQQMWQNAVTYPSEKRTVYLIYLRKQNQKLPAESKQNRQKPADPVQLCSWKFSRSDLTICSHIKIKHSVIFWVILN